MVVLNGFLNFGDGLLNMPLHGASVMSLVRCVGLIVNFLMGCLVHRLCLAKL